MGLAEIGHLGSAYRVGFSLLTNHIVGRVAASAIASASWMSFFCALAIDRRRHLGLDDLGQGLPGQADDTTCPSPAHQPAWPSPPRAKWSEKRFLRRVDWRSIPTHLPDDGFSILWFERLSNRRLERHHRQAVLGVRVLDQEHGRLKVEGSNPAGQPRKINNLSAALDSQRFPNKGSGKHRGSGGRRRPVSDSTRRGRRTSEPRRALGGHPVESSSFGLPWSPPKR